MCLVIPLCLASFLCQMSPVCHAIYETYHWDWERVVGTMMEIVVRIGAKYVVVPADVDCTPLAMD